MEDIVLLHRKSNQKNECPFPTFSTCLRQVSFVPTQELSFTLPEDTEVLTGLTATSFLIETLCGLHSPVLGETEVFGQFKNFLEKQNQDPDNLLSQNSMKKWFNFIFQQVKEIRTAHLKDQGPNSYGSFVRLHSKEFKKISLFGSGHLAQEILPWMTEYAQVEVFCRDSKSLEQLPIFKQANTRLIEYKSANEMASVLVVAASMTDECLRKELARFPTLPERIIDLRKRDTQENIFPQVPRYHSLEEFFTIAATSAEVNLEKKNSLVELIGQKAKAFHHRIDVRPMGWDDICA